MFIKNSFLLAVTLIAATLVVAQNPGNAQVREYGLESGTAPPGKKEYIQNGCYQCHGFQGQGAGATGARLAPGPLPYEAFAKLVRKPRDVMPAYPAKVLSEEKLKKIYEYLQSIPPSPQPSEIPLLSEKQ